MFKGLGGWQLVEIRKFEDSTLFVLKNYEVTLFVKRQRDSSLSGETENSVTEKWIYVYMD